MDELNNRPIKSEKVAQEYRVLKMVKPRNVEIMKRYIQKYDMQNSIAQEVILHRGDSEKMKLELNKALAKREAFLTEIASVL
jgi:hypothetical protein